MRHLKHVCDVDEDKAFFLASILRNSIHLRMDRGGYGLLATYGVPLDHDRYLWGAARS